ncbi:transaldolase [Granulicoccus phenolivorans]|uniref:transaldolase n=1 Tax=Granulicoccus phenolivorans TaxID=266854 RepID=UPI0003F5A46C|nr:transaldolase [Granulicoccus phenolivorans]
MEQRLRALADAGVSIWLDDLSRDRINSGNLADLIENYSVVGVTTNPTIFAAALKNGQAYSEQIGRLKAEGLDVAAVIKELTTDDVRNACDVFDSVAAETEGEDGRVSIEVDPDLARDTDATIAQAKFLAEKVDRANVFIKIPATREGLPAITAVIGAGISVNVTLIFSLQRYQEVIDAYLAGLEQAKAAGLDLAKIRSVASFFVSRVDTEVDKRLEGTKYEHLRGKAAVANARLAYEMHLNAVETERYQALLGAGANVQRPLWASTGVKNPTYPDTLYVTELVAQDTVNTMPEKTMKAFADHGATRGDQITPNLADARAVMADLKTAGIDMDDVVQVLEDEGVDKFVVSWNELVDTVEKALEQA